MKSLPGVRTDARSAAAAKIVIHVSMNSLVRRPPAVNSRIIPAALYEPVSFQMQANDQLLRGHMNKKYLQVFYNCN
jgi:hypothetical protein